MSVPAYPAYKASEVQWLGAIPTHWDIFQSRRQFSQRQDRAFEGDQQLTASQKYGVIYQADFMAIEGQKVVQVIHGHDILKHVEPNDFVISMRSFQGGIEWCGNRGCISSAYVMLIPGKKIVPAFFKYVFKSLTYIQALQSTTNLVRDGQALRFDNFVQVPLPDVPFSEQTAIAAFLDRETAKIDELVEEQRRLIALLKEKRQAVISHAVTKGLDPSTPMKDSGVEWLGEVPAHWEVAPLKRFWSVTDCKHLTADFVEDGIPLASIREVQSYFVNLDTAKQTTDAFYAALIEGDRLPTPGDLIFSRNATVGEVAQVAEWHPRFAMGQDVCLLRRSDPTSSPDFLQMAMRSRLVTEQLATAMIGSTFKRVNVEEIRNLTLVFPPSAEQTEIVGQLQSKIQTYDVLTGEAENAVALLQERRAALISAAVTGKIDIRGLVATLDTQAAA